MKKLISAILVGGMLLTLCACGDVSRQQKEVIYPKAVASDDYDGSLKQQMDNPVESSFIASVNNFSYNTAQVLLKDTTDNFNYSPLSLYYALALAGTGAGSQTQQEIFNLLGVSSNEELSKQSSNLYRLLYSDNNISKLKIANSLWLDNDVKFKDSFVSNAADNFYASTHSLDFSDKDSAKAMSDWISENTDNILVPNINLNPDDILSIINTIYYYSEWLDEFNKKLTKQDTFHGESKDIKADFMSQTKHSTGFLKGDGFSKSSLFLKDNGSMTFILPDKGVSISELISKKGSVQDLFEEGEQGIGKVVWKIPKFKFDTACNLKDTLKTLGIVKAFRETADFSDITDEMAFIGDVMQNTHIGIDEKGVEAAAFTQLLYAGASTNDGEAEMLLDRPFIYGIKKDGILVYIGVCNNPSK